MFNLLFCIPSPRTYRTADHTGNRPPFNPTQHERKTQIPSQRGELQQLDVSYLDAQTLVQGFLKKLGHGRLKTFYKEVEAAAPEERGINYQSLISIRSNNLKRPAPLIVQRILRDGMGVETEYHKDASGDKQYVYRFKDKETAEAFELLKELYVESPTEPNTAE